MTEEEASKARDIVLQWPKEVQTSFIERYDGLDSAGKEKVLSNVLTKYSGASNSSEIVSGNKPNTNILNSNKVEQGISNRRSDIKGLINDPVTLSGMQQHPFKNILRMAGAVYEALEGVPANAMLEIQNKGLGGLRDFPRETMQTLRGERPTQRGDIFRNIGVPEGISATLGLLSGGAKFSPETIATNSIFSGANKATQFTNILNKYGKPVVAKAMSVFADIPEKQILKAIDNPKLLSKNWLAKEGAKAKDLYKKDVQPLIDDATKRVNVTNAKNIAQDLGIINKNGEFTKVFSSMQPHERAKFLRLEGKINKVNDMSFNEVDALLGEMDSYLKTPYKKIAEGKTVDYSDDFIRVIRGFRNKVNDLRKVQFPEAGKSLTRYENWKAGESLYKNFDRWMPHLMPSIVAGATTGLITGGSTNPVIYGSAILAASPKVQSMMMRANQTALQNLMKSGAVAPQGISSGSR